MIVARVIQGGGGAIFPLAFSIMRDEFPRERVAGAIGVLSALIGVGAGIAIVLAGPIVDNLSIHWLFWIPAIMTADRARRDDLLGAGVAHHGAGPHQPARGADALGLARLSAARRQRGRRLGLVVAARDRPLRRRRGAVRRLARDRAARRAAAGRRAHDAHPGGLVDEHLGDAVRLRHVLGDDRRAGLPAEPRERRLRLRRVDHGVGPRPAAALGRDAGRGHPHGRVLDALRLQGAARRRLDLQRARHALPDRRARQRVELLRRHGARRIRHRLRVLGDVEPRRRGGAAEPDGCRDRHERERAHDRRRDRQPDRRLDHRRGRSSAARCPQERGYDIAFIVLGVALGLGRRRGGLRALACQPRAVQTEGHEFDTLAVDAGAIAAAEAGLAIGERLQ